MSEENYRQLAKHLDRLPGRFAPSETGAELRILERLFTPEEAELALHLTLEREEAQAIAARAELPVEEAERRLAEIAQKGLILSVRREDGVVLYQATPWVIGVYEFQVKRLSDALVRDIDEWGRTRIARPVVETIPQIRTIPVGESIEPRLEVLAYEQVNQLVETNDKFAVAPCICRRVAKMRGKGCDVPDESCLIFGDFADYYVRTGRGRAIDRSEVLALLASADQHNLVLQPTNSQRIDAICCCCGCCCGILKGLQRQHKPAEAVASAFIASLDVETCRACWTCLDRCQMQALTQGEDHVELNRDRCIGCGLCVSTCPSGALTLERKPVTERTQPPATMQETWRIIAGAQNAAQPDRGSL